MANLRTVEPKQTMIDRTEDPRAPVPGAVKVFFRIDGMWVHKGWLMPEVGSNVAVRGK